MAAELTPDGWAGEWACPACGAPLEGDGQCDGCMTRTAPEPREVLSNGVAITERQPKRYDPVEGVADVPFDPFALSGPMARQWRAVEG